MKSKLTIAIILIFCLNLKLKAQSRIPDGQYTSYVEPSTKAQLQDSVKKYRDINDVLVWENVPYSDTAKEKRIIWFIDRENLFQHKIDSIDDIAQKQKVINQRLFLETKYKIKLP